MIVLNIYILFNPAECPIFVDMEEPKRLFIGGLFHNVTECELEDRFKHFGKVFEVEIRRKKDESGML